MNIYRKKSTNSQSSFAVLDESQDSLKPISACSIGCDPIFEVFINKYTLAALLLMRIRVCSAIHSALQNMYICSGRITPNRQPTVISLSLSIRTTLTLPSTKSSIKRIKPDREFVVLSLHCSFRNIFLGY